jgi:hypothetical protein
MARPSGQSAEPGGPRKGSLPLTPRPSAATAQGQPGCARGESTKRSTPRPRSDSVTVSPSLSMGASGTPSLSMGASGTRGQGFSSCWDLRHMLGYNGF